MFVTDSADAFQHLFVNTLRNMLSPDEAGAFILVLANSMQDDELRNGLKQELDANFKTVQSGIRQGRLDITADDLAVFEAIETIGIDSLCCWQRQNTAEWELVYNPMRALRPVRVSSEVIDSIRQPFDENRFNFNKPFLQPEILWQGRWNQTQLRVLYNKFPFAPCHLIIVPDPDMQMPQYLTADYHHTMWNLIEQQQFTLPGFGAGYNSLGACASVNQLHFQSFVRAELLPIERQHWKHNGGGVDYPMHCYVSGSVRDSWAMIDECHNNNQPYNLLYRPGCCYVIPRKMQGSESVSPRGRGAGWIEECGVFNVSDKAELETLGAEEIDNCLRSLSVAGS
jgi:ATP adenylyltransferase/5',5'''-P-1,P-4-tetraphosphate phosphorylase II